MPTNLERLEAKYGNSNKNQKKQTNLERLEEKYSEPDPDLQQRLSAARNKDNYSNIPAGSLSSEQMRKQQLAEQQRNIATVSAKPASAIAPSENKPLYPNATIGPAKAYKPAEIKKNVGAFIEQFGEGVGAGNVARAITNKFTAPIEQQLKKEMPSALPRYTQPDTRFENANPVVKNVGKFAGQLTKELGYAATGQGITGAALSKIPLLAEAIQKTPNVVQAITKGGMIGAAATGLKQIAEPKENKPGLKGLVTNVALWGGGAFGGELASKTIGSLTPQLSKIPGLVDVVMKPNGAQTMQVKPAVEALVRGASNNLTGTIAALPTVSDEEKKQFVKEFGPNLLAQGIMDVVSGLGSKGNIKISDLEKSGLTKKQLPFLKKAEVPGDTARMLEPEMVERINSGVGEIKTKPVGAKIKPNIGKVELAVQGLQNLVDSDTIKVKTAINPDLPEAKTIYDTPKIIAQRKAQEQAEPTSKINTPERIQLRKDIENNYYGNGAVDKNADAVIVIGLPGSGKSSIANPLAEETGALVVDADKIREQLPEFKETKNAYATQDEASSINGNVLAKAIQNRDNVVLPIVGKTLEKINATIDALKEGGYKVHVKYVDLPIDETVKRAVVRWEAGDQGFVDPDYIVNKVGDNPKNNYYALKNNKGVDSYEFYSNDVPKGQKPILIESSRTEVPAGAGGRRLGGQDNRGDQEGNGHAATKVNPTQSEPGIFMPETEVKKAEVPIDERNYEDVSKRNVKSYQYDHPEVADHIQAEAIRLIGETNDPTFFKGQKIVTKDYEEGATYRNFGITKNVGETFQRIQDATKATYPQINKALEDIANNRGSENYALAKKIELIIDDNLTKGTADVRGNQIEPDADYIAKKKQIEGGQNGVQEKGQTGREIKLASIEDYVSGKTELPNTKEELESVLEAVNNAPEEQKRRLNLQFFAEKVKKKLAEISRLGTNTLAKSELLTPEEKQTVLNPENFAYERKNEEQSLKEANKRLKADAKAEEEKLANKDSFTGADLDTAMGILKNKIAEARKSGDYTDVIRWSQIIRKNGSTEAGRAVQAHAKYSRTPEGTLNEAHAVVEDAKKEIEKNQPKKAQKVKEDTKKAKEAVDKSRKDAARQAVEELTPEEMLAKRVVGTTKQGKETKPDPVKQMVDELFRVAKESPLPMKKPKTSDPYAFLRDAIQNKNAYTDVWEKAKKIITEKYGSDSKVMVALNDYLNKGIVPTYSEATLNKSVNAAMEDLEQKLIDISKSTKENRQKVLDDLTDYLVDVTGASREEATLLSNKITNRFNKLVEEKTKAALKTLFPEKTETTKPDTIKSIEELGNLGAFSNENYKNKVAAKLTPKVQKLLKESDINLGKLVRRSVSDVNFTKGMFLTELETKLKIDRGEAQLILNETNKIFNELAKEKRLSILNSMFKKRESVKTQKTLADKVVELINLGAYDDASIRALIDEKEGMPVLNNDDIAFIIEKSQELQQLSEGSYESRTVEAQIKKRIADKIPKTIGDKIRGLQRISLILNPKTVLTRNPGGNILLHGLEAARENTVGALVDAITSKSLGTERTTIFDPVGKTKAYFGGMKTGAQEWAKDVKLGIDTSPTNAQIEMPKGRTFKNNLLNSLDEILRYSLQLGDRPFYQGAYSAKIAELKKIKKTGTVTEDMEIQARLYALDKVFQNDSYLSKKAKELKHSLGFVGDIAIPFTQTPANILDKLLDYNPVGLAKGVYQLGKTKGTEAFNQQIFVDRVSRSLTGGGIMLLGYVLASKELLTGKEDKSKKGLAFLNTAGHKSYAIKIGDKFYTYDWSQPSGSMLAIGADMYLAGKDKEDVLSKVAVGTEGAVNTMFKQSFLQGLTRLLSGYSPAASLGSTLLSAPLQGTPTIGSQIAQLVDPYVRETKGNNFAETVVNRGKARLPFLSKTLPQKIDSFGEPVKQYQGRNNIFNVMLNPGFYSELKDDPATKMVYDLYNKTGNTDILPKTPITTITDGENKITLTPTQQNDFKKLYGRMVKEAYDEATGDSGFANMDSADQVEYLEDQMNSVYRQAKEQFTEKLGIKPEPKQKFY